MKRREFLKAILAAPAVVAVPALAKTKEPQAYWGKIEGIGFCESPPETVTVYGEPVLYTNEIIAQPVYDDLIEQMARNARAAMDEIALDVIK